MSHFDPELPLSRRDFLQLAVKLGGIAIASSILQACAESISAVPLEQPSVRTVLPTTTINSTTTTKPEQVIGEESPSPASEIAQEGMASVAFVKTTNRTEGVHTAIDLLGTNPVRDKTVFLKPNFNSADPTPGSTHIDVLRSMVMKLTDMGASRITIGDRSGMGSTRAVMQEIGVFDLADELGFNIIVFDELETDDWVIMQPTGSHWENGFYFAKPCLDADVIVQTCCLKTHQYGGHFTMSLKNSVGMVAKRVPGDSHDYMTELHRSNYQREMIAEMNAAYTPVLIVLDGVEAFVSGGPAKGSRVDSEVVLVGTDRIAMDAIGVALLRYHGNNTKVAKGAIFEQAQIARAVELGLGVESPDKIKFLTDDGDSAAYAELIKEILLT